MVRTLRLADDVIERFHLLAKRLVASGLTSSVPWIEMDWRRAASEKGFPRTIRYWDGIIAAAKLSPQAKKCLDAGCGSGILSALLSLAGAASVISVDILPEAVRVTREVAKSGQLPNVTVIEGDIADVAMGQGRLDLVYSIEAISHYRDYRGFLRAMRSAIAEGGVLVVRDGNNSANPLTVRKTRRLWRAFEYGHPQGKCDGHNCSRTGYVGMRKEMIKAAFPHLSETEISAYACWTSGYNRLATLQAVARFLAGDYCMKREFSPHTCPLDPEEDMLGERLFSPYDLAEELTDLGFDSTVRAHASDRFPVADRLWGLLSPLTIHFSRAFFITASKQ